MNEEAAIGSVRADLERLLQVGVWLVALVVLFVVEPPPITRAAGTPPFVHATGFVAAIAIALILVATRRPRRRLATLRWITLGVLIVSVAAFFGYLGLISVWTCDYDGNGPVVIGSELFPGARRYAAEIGRTDCATLIADVAGRTDELWPKSDLVARQLALAACFMITVLGFASSAVLAIETLRLGSPHPRRADPS